MFEAAGVLEELNDEQRQAATHAGGPLLVLAGAGTGKTGTLVARAAWLRAQGVEASRILLLTFTRRAADDMLARVAQRHGNSGDRICGGTFHAIAHRIIRAHAESFSLPPAFSVIDPADVADVLDTLRADHDLVGVKRRAPRAQVCADIYTRCVNTQTTIAEVVAESFPWVREFTGQLAGLFRDYVAHKRRHALVDFDDLLLLWRAALADVAAGPALRGLFDAVLVDEYQDVNAVQAEIVRLLRNYRSRRGVLGLANVIRPQFDGLELSLSAERGEGHRPQLVRCHDEATQAREICVRILADHEAGLRFQDQAVLVRAAHHSDLLEIELAARGI